MCQVCILSCTLNVLLSRLGKCKDSSDPQSLTNYRYLSDSEKNARLNELHHENRIAKRRIAHLEKRIEVEGEQLDEEHARNQASAHVHL